MSMTDPIADLLTRIRNGLRVQKRHVDLPSSRIKEGICRVLKDEGFITDFAATAGTRGAQGSLRVELKYGPDDEVVIRHIQRVSKPARRIYREANELAPVLNNQGIAILSTNQGVLSDREARERNVGGELIAIVW